MIALITIQWLFLEQQEHPSLLCDGLDAGVPMAKHQGGDGLPPSNDAACSKIEPGRATRTPAVNSKCIPTKMCQMMK